MIAMPIIFYGKILHVHRLRDFNRAARLEKRTALSPVVRLLKARCLDQTVTARRVGAAAVDERAILFDGARFADGIAAVNHRSAHGTKPGSPGIHRLLDFIGVRWGLSAMIDKHILRHCDPPLHLGSPSGIIDIVGLFMLTMRLC